MKTIELKIEMLDYWHAGTGAGLGPIADAEPVKDGLGLPYLPGKTLRGLIRDLCEMAEDAGQALWPKGRVERLFGRRASDRQDTTTGLLHFTNASLDRQTQAWLKHQDNAPELADSLYKRIAQTAVDIDKGVVKDKSLRVMEVTVPLRLIASIEGPDDEQWVEPIVAVLPHLRAMGTSRRRGFGRLLCELGEEV